MKKIKEYESPQIEISLLIMMEDILTESYDADIDEGDDEEIWSDWY